MTENNTFNRRNMEWANNASFKIRFISGLITPVGILALNQIFKISFPLFPLFAIGMFEAFVNQPYPFIRKRLKHLERLLYVNTFIDVISITFFVHYTGGINIPFFAMLYLLPIIFATTNISIKTGLFLSSFSSLTFGALLVLEYFGIINSITILEIQLSAQQQIIFFTGTVFFFYMLCYFSYIPSSQLWEKSKNLEKRTRELNEALNTLKQIYAKLRQSYINSIESLAAAVDARDHYTQGHLRRVCDYALAIGRKMNLNYKSMENLRLASLLHDIGKIGISDNILLKPDKLSDSEWIKMKEHPIVSEKIVTPLGFSREVLDAVRHHHERYDGKGYPDGKKGDELPIEAYILAVADTYDVMMSDRPYVKSLGKEKAKEELRNYKGSQFHPEVVDAFLTIL